MPIIFFFSLFLAISSVNLFADNADNNLAEYKLGPSDVINIKVWDNTDLNRNVSIAQDGTFTFPLIGKVYGGGYTAYEIENVITRKLADGYLVSPQVTISIVAYRSQKVFLFGEVQKPGRYFLKKKTHFLELISEAGGFTDEVGHTAVIVRKRSSLPRRGSTVRMKGKEPEVTVLDLQEFNRESKYDTFFVKNEDSIYVSKVQRFFVLGEVRKTGEFEWEKDLTVRQAISFAGGPKDSAALNRTKFIRTNKNGQEEEVKAKMSDFVKPDDIVVVAERYF